MTNKSNDWRYYLSAYGSDVFHWPEEGLKQTNVKSMIHSEEFQDAQELDQLMTRMEWPEVRGDLKERIVNDLPEQEHQTFSMFAFVEKEHLRQAFYVAAIMLLSFFIGFHTAPKQEGSLQNEYDTLITKIWYLGPASAFANTFPGELNE